MMSPLLFSPRSVEDRIKTAYVLRRPWWPRAFPRSRVWSRAASNLLSAHHVDRNLPVDPELFVASQPLRAGVADPWGDLTRPGSIERYRRRVRAIVRQLRRELLSEVRWVHRRLERGLPLDLVIESRTSALSPLGRYIVAIRGNREDLADQFVEEAVVQHQGSPLYREACQGLLPDDLYPADLHALLNITAVDGQPQCLYSLN